MKHSCLIQIIFTHFYCFKYSYPIQIIYTQLGYKAFQSKAYNLQTDLLEPKIEPEQILYWSE